MNYQIIKTSDELRKAIEILATQPVVGLDTETTELDPYTSRLRLIQLATPDRVYIVDFDHFANGNRKAKRSRPCAVCLKRRRPIKIAHNSKFDAKFIKHNLGADLGGLFDTLLASQLVGAGDIEERHGLETVASRYLNEAVDKSERLSNWNFELSEAQLEYAARDAAVLLPLREKLIDRIEVESLVKVAQLEFRMRDAGGRHRARGFLHAQGALARAAQHCRRSAESSLPSSCSKFWRKSRRRERLFGGPQREDINLDSQQQLTKALTRLGIPLRSRRATGNCSRWRRIIPSSARCSNTAPCRRR
jgi:DNA polymerase-1